MGLTQADSLRFLLIVTLAAFVASQAFQCDCPSRAICNACQDWCWRQQKQPAEMSSCDYTMLVDVVESIASRKDNKVDFSPILKDSCTCSEPAERRQLQSEAPPTAAPGLDDEAPGPVSNCDEEYSCHPQSSLEARQQFDASDFAFMLTDSAADYENLAANSSQTLLTVDRAPVLATLPGDGLSQMILNLGPCTVNQPHHHPRASEIDHVLKGSFVIGFIEENGSQGTEPRLLYENITQGETFIIPQGLVHYQWNTGCVDAQLVATWGHRDPGTLTLSRTMFALPDQARRAMFGTSEQVYNMVMEGLGGTARIPTQAADHACRKRCGLPSLEE